MMQKDTFEGWNFDEIWSIEEGQYPLLKILEELKEEDLDQNDPEWMHTLVKIVEKEKQKMVLNHKLF